MLQSIMTARDDGAPETGGKLRLIRTEIGQVRPVPHEEHSNGEGGGLGNSRYQDDEALAGILDRARAGDGEAFQAIFHRFVRPILAFIFHFVDDRARSEELTQETFLRAHRSLTQIPEGIKLSTWLFGIARNVAREAIRDQKRRRREVGLEDIAFFAVHDEKAGPDESFMSEELRRTIRRAVRDLSEDQRVVFILKLFSKMRYGEISRITGFSIGKLKTDLHRARHQMRERLRPYITGRVPGK